MAAPKFLIDTNVVIGLEDNHIVASEFARFLAKCHEHGARVFVHDASRADVLRDKNENRRKITLSKLRKFERLARIKLPLRSKLSNDFGNIANSNDAIDVELLFALRRNAVDFLITEDKGLIKRAYRSDLGRRVFDINEAEIWLRYSFDPEPISLHNILQQKVYQLDFSDPFFESIRADYAGFDKWLEKCSREHRDCWTVSSSSKLAALLIYKAERPDESDAKTKAKKILKICTLKVSDSFRGEKFGEQLLKQCLWYAQKNKYDLYLTVFPKQQALTIMLGRVGFEETKKLPNGECVYEKRMLAAWYPKNDFQPIDFHRKYYPRFVDNESVGKYCIPIWPQWHKRLFPELSGVPGQYLGQAAVPSASSERPGNTIRKVYLCRGPAGSLRAGDILLFYVTKELGHSLSQSITTVGIVERVRETRKYGELLRLTGKRSVFFDSELKTMVDSKDTPVKVIDFLLAGHLQEAISLKAAVKIGVLRSWPQTIGRVRPKGYDALRKVMRLGWEPDH